MKKDTPNDNVIDMIERIPETDPRASFRNLKVRFDLEHAKIAVSTSLLSIVILVTLANNNLMTSITPTTDEAVPTSFGGRSIASVPGGSQIAAPSAASDTKLVKELANRVLSPTASLGQKPSALERLAFGYFEGKYAVRLQSGKIREIEFATENNPSDAKRIDNLTSFIESQRDLLPEFARSVKVGDGREGNDQIKTFELVNEVSIPVAKVEFRVDEESRLLGLRVTSSGAVVK